MRTRAVPVAVAIAVAFAVAFAATLMANTATAFPGKLILQKNDFPAHTDYDATSSNNLGIDDALEAQHVTGAVASYLGAMYSETKGMLQAVRGVVITTPSAETAKQAFAVAVKARQDMWKQLGAKYKPFTGAPAYGDQQLAFAKQPTVLTDGSIDIVVRKSKVVWVLETLISSRQPPPQMAKSSRTSRPTPQNNRNGSAPADAPAAPRSAASGKPR